MIELKKKYEALNRRKLEKIEEAYRFENRQAPYMIYDTNYWLFGEQQNSIPEDYCGDDPDVMMQYQLKQINQHYNTREFDEDIYYGFLMPWFGTGVLASGFGTAVEMLYKMDPAVNMSEIRNPEEIDALAMPDPYRSGLMPRVLRQIDYFRENCDLPIGVTDCQGPLTTALSVIGYENYMYWMYDYPEKIHQLMDMCTTALIDWIKIQKKHMGVKPDEASFIIGARMPQGKGGVWIADDDSVIMPGDLFAEFVKPYNERVLLEFGGGGIHYCGCSNQNTQNYMNTKGLNCLHNFHLDDFEHAKEVRRACLENGKVYCLCDFTPRTENIEAYYDTVYGSIEQKGMIVVSYTAPAIELVRGKYEARERNKEDLAKFVCSVIEEKRKLYF